MKRYFQILKNQIFLFITLFLVSANVVMGQDVLHILEKFVSALDSIEGCEYTVRYQGSAPFDTANFVSDYLQKFVGVKNEEDTLVGYKYYFYAVDTTKFSSIYDYQFNVDLNWGSKEAEILPFSKYPARRELSPSCFYLTTQTMLEFFLHYDETNYSVIWQNGDTVAIDLKNEATSYHVVKDNADTLVIDLHFNDHRIEFRGNTVVIQGRKGYASSIYSVWLNKKNFLPFKVYRKQEHHASIEEILHAKINKQDTLTIDALASIPNDFTIVEYGGHNKEEVNLEGMKAPDWKLADLDGDTISLSDYKDKVVLFDFTSVSCGPCHFSIPELNDLQREFEASDFQILSIEAYQKNAEAIKKYLHKNEVQYKSFISNEDILSKYHVKAVPTFILIDKNQIVQKMITGYSKDNMQLIRTSIQALVE